MHAILCATICEKRLRSRGIGPQERVVCGESCPGRMRDGFALSIFPSYLPARGHVRARAALPDVR